MYNLTTRSKKAEKQFYEVLSSREAIRTKLEMLRNDPRGGKWSCYLGYDIRLVYEIDDENKEIVVVAEL